MFFLLIDFVFGINIFCEIVSMVGWVVVGDGVGIFVFMVLIGCFDVDGVIDVGGNCFIIDWFDKFLIRFLVVDFGVDVVLVIVVGNDRLVDLVMMI